MTAVPTVDTGAHATGNSLGRATTRSVDDLAAFGGVPLFSTPRSASNLVQPPADTVLGYCDVSLAAHRYTNNGPLVQELEARLARFHETRHCVAVANAFWGLVLAMRALALPGRAEIVLPSLTYRRMGDVAWWAGLIPRFCDVDPATLAPSAATMAACINDDTALLLAVHPIVNCCEVEPIEQLAQTSGLPLLVDGVESCYERLRSRKVGGFGNAEVFSLHASKLINGFEGGYVTTSNDDLAGRLRLMRGFGFNGPDNVEMLGFNSKLNEIHAAMALACLDGLDEQVAANRRRYLTYVDALHTIPGADLLRFDEAQQPSYKNIVVELGAPWPLSRDDTLRILHAEGILARAYYSPALHQRPTSYPARWGDLPVTEQLTGRYMLLPSGARVTTDDIVVIGALLDLLARSGERISRRLAS